MKFNFMSSIFSDSRILILLSLVFLTIIIAVALMLFEKAKGKKENIKVRQHVVNTKITEFNRIINSAKSPEEKLGIVNHNAKKLFKENFSIDVEKSYSFLVNFFTEKNLTRYTMFCQDMFNLYYSNDRINFIDVDKVVKKLATLIELSDKNKIMKPEVKQSTPSINPKGVPENERIFKDFWETRNKKNNFKPNKIVKKHEDEGPSIVGNNRGLNNQQKEIQNRINKREEDVKIQEHKNLNLLKETEDKLKFQQKLEIELQKKLKQQKEKEAIIEKQLRDGKLIDQKQLILSHDACNINKKWYHDVDTEPVMGKDWIKELKKKKQNSLI